MIGILTFVGAGLADEPNCCGTIVEEVSGDVTEDGTGVTVTNWFRSMEQSDNKGRTIKNSAIIHASFFIRLFPMAFIRFVHKFNKRS